MEITTKQELKELICSGKNKTGYYSRELIWKSKFTELYNELQSWAFPTYFTFNQKIYHYINDDEELKLGLCVECGKRCTFVGISKGYRKYCSKTCIMNSKEIREKIKSVKLARYGDENFSNRDKARDTVKNKSLEERKQSELKREKTCLERYGTRLASQSTAVKEKIKNTCKEKSSVIVEKRKATCIEKYGDENFNNRDKAKETCLEKYNSEYVFQSDYFKDSRHQTLVERYDVDSPLKSEIFKDKREQTCLDRYGKKFVTQTDEFKKKSNQTRLEKYGDENYTNRDKAKETWNNKSDDEIISFVNNINNTKKKNNSFNTSKIEEQLQQYLTENNIHYIYQYTSDKYPFACDFYFPENDLYVEIQGTWTHGPHPFTNSEEDMLLLEKWKSRGTDFYKSAIETWTVRDVKKRETAKQNNLNYLEIFSCDLDECIEQIMFIYK